LRPHERGIHPGRKARLNWATVEPTRPYQREHYRVPLPITYPVMFSVAAMIGEGKVTNLSVFGCAIECSDVVPEQTKFLVRLILPDQKESLPIEGAEVRWVRGKQVGLRFGQLAREANLRLHVFVWDRMFERLQILKQQGALNLYS
ncbi:MAG: PilZ domain-containing protein, partial [Nitrospiraceae bacterium]